MSLWAWARSECESLICDKIEKLYDSSNNVNNNIITETVSSIPISLILFAPSSSSSTSFSTLGVNQADAEEEEIHRNF